MERSFWQDFKDEAIATALILGLAVVATFFAASRLYPEQKNSNTEQELAELKQKEIARQIDDAIGMVLADSDEEGDSGNNPSSTSQTVEVVAVPTVAEDPAAIEVVFGQEGHFGFDDYSLVLNQPRLVFSTTDAGKKTFVVDVSMENFTVAKGLPTNLTASIIQDGNLIVPSTPLSSTQSDILLPGEKLDFQARISLVEGTDVKEIFYEPPGLSETVRHTLKPND